QFHESTFQLAYVGLGFRRDEDTNILREANPFCFGFFVENCHFGFQVGGLNVNQQTPLETRAKAVDKTWGVLWGRIAGDDNLFLMLEEFVERMEEFVLGSLLAPKDLNVVDEKNISGAIVLLEQRHPLGLDAIDHLIHEAFAGGVDNAARAVLLR